MRQLFGDALFSNVGEVFQRAVDASEVLLKLVGPKDNLAVLVWLAEEPDENAVGQAKDCVTRDVVAKRNSKVRELREWCWVLDNCREDHFRYNAIARNDATKAILDTLLLLVEDSLQLRVAAGKLTVVASATNIHGRATVMEAGQADGSL